MNSLPKLSRHRKSDLLANELEGSPQKPSVAVHFSKRRIAGPDSQRLKKPNGGHQGKIEDSGVTKEKVVYAATQSSVLPPDTTIYDCSEKLDFGDPKKSILS